MIERVVRNLARWVLLLCFVGWGVYMLIWAFQSASFSVHADPILSEIYKTRALLLLPLSVLSMAVGALFFVCLRPQGVRDR